MAFDDRELLARLVICGQQTFTLKLPIGLWLVEDRAVLAMPYISIIRSARSVLLFFTAELWRNPQPTRKPLLLHSDCLLPKYFAERRSFYV